MACRLDPASVETQVCGEAVPCGACTNYGLGYKPACGESCVQRSLP
ncbi:hypothetical protein [Desulfofarcimen acetoxidans]|nr:hypothetical protein [Desulfofarcimen acetoxidans]